MPIIPGDLGIKSFSYEILVTGDGTDSWEECEDCLKAQGEDPLDSKHTPIFADTEMDRNPVCETCYHVSFIFSPTDECIRNWAEMLKYYVDTGFGDTEFLDQVAEQFRWLSVSSTEEEIEENYLEKRRNEQ